MDPSTNLIRFEGYALSLWRYRGLLRSLVVRNIRVKYQASLLGFAWTLLNPLLTLSVLLAVFTRVVRIPIPDYWAFLVSGFFVWNYVNQTLNYGTLAVEEHGSLVRNYAFPSEIPVFAGALSRLFEFVIELTIIVAVFTLFHHGAPTASLLLLPVLIVLQFLVTLGLTMMVATLAVFYEDVRHMLPIGLTALFYLSPVFYAVDLVPEGLRRFYVFNPLASMLVSYQKVLYEGVLPPGGTLAVLAGSALFLCAAGLAVFRRYRNLFAEIV